jgi:hypothetical protein
MGGHGIAPVLRFHDGNLGAGVLFGNRQCRTMSIQI